MKFINYTIIDRLISLPLRAKTARTGTFLCLFSNRALSNIVLKMSVCLTDSSLSLLPVFILNAVFLTASLPSRRISPVSVRVVTTIPRPTVHPRLEKVCPWSLSWSD